MPLKSLSSPSAASRDNVTELSGSGICGIAVISAIFAQKDIVSATKDLKEQTLRMLENK